MILDLEWFAVVPGLQILFSCASIELFDPLNAERR